MKELDFEKFYEDFPRLFRRDKEPFELSVGEGWEPLIRRLCEEIEANRGEASFRVAQIKQKFGGLRVHLDNFYLRGISENNPVLAALSKAEKESYHICEICGQEGKLVGSNFLKIRCEKHEDE